MAIQVDLPGSIPRIRTIRSTRPREAAPPSAAELSPEAAALIEAVGLGPVRPLRMALVGAAPWDAGVVLRPTMDVDYQPSPTAADTAALRRGSVVWHNPAHPLVSADAIVIGDPVETGGRRRPGASSLAETCATVAEAAIPGQTIIVASASYVGSTREFLIGPLERRGFVVGQDVHVAFCAPFPNVTEAQARRVHHLGGATPDCAKVAAGIVGQLAAVDIASTLERAEATALGGRPRSRLAAGAKRAFDIVVATTAIIVLLPILLLIALAILLDDGRPILFSQERVGQNGHRFRFWKFRTMVDGAEARLDEVLALNQIRGPGFQLDHDPRVTRIGRFLRKGSLDELPQLWNILRGDMSLVGPRPAPPVEVAAYEPWHRRRLSAKPGLTGLAQIRARSYVDFDEKATHDLAYIDQWSLLLDLKILLLTVPTVLRFTGR